MQSQRDRFSFHLCRSPKLAFHAIREAQWTSSVLPSSAASPIEPSPTSTGNLSLGRRRLWSERLDALGTSGGDLTVREIAGVQVRVEVRVGQFGSYGEPARSNGAVATEQVQPVEEETTRKRKSVFVSAFPYS